MQHVASTSSQPAPPGSREGEKKNNYIYTYIVYIYIYMIRRHEIKKKYDREVFYLGRVQIEAPVFLNDLQRSP